MPASASPGPHPQTLREQVATHWTSKGDTLGRERLSGRPPGGPGESGRGALPDLAVQLRVGGSVLAELGLPSPSAARPSQTAQRRCGLRLWLQCVIVFLPKCPPRPFPLHCLAPGC